MNRTTFTRIFTAAAFAVVGAATASAASAAAPAPKSISISYADLDLGKPQGVDALYARLRGAAKAACGDYDARTLWEKSLARGCREEALSNAVAKIDHAALTAKHLRQSPERVAQVERRQTRS